MRADETAAQCTRREQLEVAQQAAPKAEDAEEIEEAKIAALLAEANSQAHCPPTTVDEWKAHIVSGTMPAVEYFLTRLQLTEIGFCLRVQ